MNAHLFVYGTLMAAARHPKGERLRGEARLIGEASVPGRLYRVSTYPGLVWGDPRARVHGEVYALSNPAASFKWLDAYEGIVAAEPKGNQYERVERPVRLASGEEVTAWVYLYLRDVAGLRAIPSGRWTSEQG
jgi:gamma-glutamylcyclotransferase (GGCT)/AIG2-like uncharacterized protein YtfP